VDEEARIGCLAWAITSPSHHNHARLDLQHGISIDATTVMIFCFSLLFTSL
jgi:hypothetical protein